MCIRDRPSGDKLANRIGKKPKASPLEGWVTPNPTEVVCYRCQEKGHFAAKCPAKPKKQGMSPQISLVTAQWVRRGERENDELVSDLPTKTLKVKEKDVHMLPDCGAQSNMIEYGLVKDLGLVREETPKPFVVVGAMKSGCAENISKQVELSFVVFGTQVTGTFFVFRDTRIPVILNVPFIKRNRDTA